MTVFKAHTPKKARIAADEDLEKDILRFLIGSGISYTTRPELLTDLTTETNEIQDVFGHDFESKQYGFLNIKTVKKNFKIKTYVLEGEESDVTVLSEADLTQYEVFCEYGQDGAKMSIGEDAELVIPLTIVGPYRFMEVTVEDQDGLGKFKDIDFPSKIQRESQRMYTLLLKKTVDELKAGGQKQ
ncbi:uncharacterized protein NDAI_0B05350 [Naumovozyma dairenensis CBS 421]|uniref:Uncharacterized protein n=1 Tax=Naumovozyma dairenensis (strain ATCC 10597 / BCRC 20456 / CBS 421 / NBRC 0211 / NRRL Y-12639) TaxID=1071378 RepID=G0W707_NAUDC|nr:hypothetical protein NDAI_0B05350 [Naumovozyma dairenensis CBS 421]CCD23568.1 hypothetical protein NDAI_0B05350 [Naumovozyma dairenensis CBS 421]